MTQINTNSSTEKKLTETIIGCAMRVHNTLGSGFLEKVYENALVVEAKHAGLFVEQQVIIPIRYRDQLIGEYVADLVIEKCILLELKAVSALRDEFTAVCLNHLRATQLPIALLINFAKPRLEWKRIVGETYATWPTVL